MNNEPITPEVQSSPDAVKWAKAFVKVFPDADEATMVAWFANAMMAMHDWQERKITDLQAEIERMRGILGIWREKIDGPTDFDMQTLLDVTDEALNAKGEE